jgi:hypothetical protein
MPKAFINLMDALNMDIGTFLFLMFVGMGIYHYLNLYRLARYLKENHPNTWETLIKRHLLGIHLPRGRGPLLGGNYFKELRFAFSSDDLNDDSVLLFKRNVQLSFVLFITLIFFTILLCLHMA